jgi:hypothetical protein
MPVHVLQKITYSDEGGKGGFSAMNEAIEEGPHKVSKFGSRPLKVVR